MKFIKSTERLPEKSGQYFIKEIIHGELCYSVDYWGMIGGIMDFSERMGGNEFEWLDESDKPFGSPVMMPTTPKQEGGEGVSMFTDEEVVTAKRVRDSIIKDGDPSLKSIYMAGEIVMWDEIKNSHPTHAGLVDALEKIVEDLMQLRIKAENRLAVTEKDLYDVQMSLYAILDKYTMDTIARTALSQNNFEKDK